MMIPNMEQLAHRYPDLPSVVWKDGSLSRTEVVRTIQRLQEALKTLVGKYGSNIALLSQDNPYTFPLYIAAVNSPVRLIILNPRITSVEVAQLLEQFACNVVLYSEGFDVLIPDGIAAHSVNSLIATDLVDEVNLNGMSIINHSKTVQGSLVLTTSGVSGMPKGVVVTLDALQARIDGVIARLELSEGDIYLACVPSNYAFGIGMALPVLLIGGKIIIEEQFDPKQLLLIAEQQKVTFFAATPTMWRFILAEQLLQARKFTNLRLCATAGEFAPNELLAELAKAFMPITVIYGSSETDVIATGRLINGECFLHPLPYIMVTLSPIDRSTSVGELLVASPGLFSGYMTADSEISEPSEGIWHSGDMVQMSADAFILLGRIKLLIKRGAQSISPIEVEIVLRQLSGVTDAVVVGIPNSILGELSIAFINASSRMERRTLVRHCQSRLASYKIPDQFIFIEEFPITNGKVDRRKLQAIAQERERAI